MADRRPFQMPSRGGYDPINDGVRKGGSSAAWTAGAIAGVIVVAGVIVASIMSGLAYGSSNGNSNSLTELVQPCSPYKAFGAPGTKQGFTADLDASIKSTWAHRIRNGVQGGYSVGRIGNEYYEHFAGYADSASQRAFANNTWYRVSSISRGFGALGFFKMAAEHNINADDQVARFFPAYANAKVIQVYTPAVVLSETNPLTTTAASTTVEMTTAAAHGFTTGDRIAVSGFAGTLDGIPAAELNQVATITVTGATTFTYVVTTAATAGMALIGGGPITFAKVETGVFQTTPVLNCPGGTDGGWATVYYYKLVPIDTPITIHHILEETVGWSYAAVNFAPNFCSAFVRPSHQYYKEGIIQNQIQFALGVGMAYDGFPPFGAYHQPIQTWAVDMAALPLMHQPGASWTWGPSYALLGAIMEKGDADAVTTNNVPPKARKLSVMLKEEIFDPLGMTDTLIYLSDTDPRRADLLSRLATMYLSYTNLPVTSVAALNIPNFYDANYATTAPRTTEYLDLAFMSTPADCTKFNEFLRAGGLLPNGQRLIPATYFAQMSRTMSRHYNFNMQGEGNTMRQSGGTYGYSTIIGGRQATGDSQSARQINYNCFFGSRCGVDYGHDMTYMVGSNTFPPQFDATRTQNRFQEHIKCIRTDTTEQLTTLE